MDALVAFVVGNHITLDDRLWFSKMVQEDFAPGRSLDLYFGLTKVNYLIINDEPGSSSFKEAKATAMEFLQQPIERDSSTAQHVVGMLIYYFECESDAKPKLSQCRAVDTQGCSARRRGGPIRARRDVPLRYFLRRPHALRPQVHQAGIRARPR
jgi:hypothetical protein